MEQFQKLYRIMVWIQVFTGAVACALMPPLVLAYLVNLLCTAYALNRILVAVAVFVGLICGVYFMYRYLKSAQKAMGALEDQGTRHKD